MTTPYALPPPIVTIVHGFTPEQMQQAFKDGAASRDGEIEALRAVIKRIERIALIDPPHAGQMMEIAAAIAAEATK